MVFLRFSTALLSDVFSNVFFWWWMFYCFLMFCLMVFTEACLMVVLMPLQWFFWCVVRCFYWFSMFPIKFRLNLPSGCKAVVKNPEGKPTETSELRKYKTIFEWLERLSKGLNRRYYFLLLWMCSLIFCLEYLEDRSLKRSYQHMKICVLIRGNSSWHTVVKLIYRCLKLFQLCYSLLYIFLQFCFNSCVQLFFSVFTVS